MNYLHGAISGRQYRKNNANRRQPQKETNWENGQTQEGTKIGRAAQKGRLWTIWSLSSHRAARPGPVNDSRASQDRQAVSKSAVSSYHYDNAKQVAAEQDLQYLPKEEIEKRIRQLRAAKRAGAKPSGPARLVSAGK